MNNRWYRVKWSAALKNITCTYGGRIMKKLIDKYKVPGYERQSTFYVIKHGHCDKKDVQLQAELNIQQTPAATEQNQLAKRPLKNKTSFVESIQLTLDLS